MGLYDMVLIKENHLRAAGGVARAVALARAAAPGVQVEVEVEDMEQLEAAIAADVDLVLLDNMDDGQLAEAVKRVAGRVLTEASGNMTAARIHGLREIGLDRVSMGGLIHQATWVDMGLELVG
jgi:nicotinate-nucleotide pyrophosphorylase (carboxylating)